MAKFEVLGGDFDKGDAWIYLDGSFVFRKHKTIQKNDPARSCPRTRRGNRSFACVPWAKPLAARPSGCSIG